MFLKILSLLAFLSIMYAADLKVENRGDWALDSIGQQLTDSPSNLKYFQYYDVLPEEINVKIFEKKDLSTIANKKLFVGYGIADAKGKNCMIFNSDATGIAEPITICLPWWRIEREYKNEATPNSSTISSLDKLRKPKPPILVNVCESSKGTKYYSGGNISCTSYFDKLTDADCWNNPMQSKCFVDNCSSDIVNNCTYKETIIGDDTTLETAVTSSTDLKPQHTETKVNLASHIYNCPGGSLASECTQTKTALMFPYECKPDDPNTSVDDGEYIYCDETKPVYTNGNITGFNGSCSDGRPARCEVNSFKNSTAECTEPIYETFNKYANYDFEAKRSYQEVNVDVLSGEIDSYSADENCLRSNTIDQSRDRELYVKMIGSGSLDDDIYVLSHSEGGDFNRIYCNMQHAGASPSMTTNVQTCLGARNFTGTLTASMINDAVSCGTGSSIFSGTDAKNCMIARGHIFGTTGDLKAGDEDIIFSCGQSSVGGNATKYYNGVPLSCIRNNGSYSFNETVNIQSTDIVTVQQNSEQEYNTAVPFAAGRNHYTSSKVTMDNVEVAPSAYSNQFPYYPTNSGYLRTWDNTTATFSILFPFASSYEIYFYNKNGDEVGKATLIADDFKNMGTNGNLNIKLGGKMKLASGITEDSANRTDPWVEWGGGTFGGRNSMNGQVVASPNDAFVKENAVTNIIVKDLIMGAITPITMVYPLPYPNRIFASKLKVYEHRKYRCYSPFGAFTPPNTNSTNKIVCTSDEAWKNYDNGMTNTLAGVQTWPDTTTCEQNCFTQNTCVSTTNGTEKGYTCAQKAGENLDGDLGGNFFSTLTSCNQKCVKNNPCTTYAESDCEAVNESMDQQAQDFTGKTLYTRKNVTYRCKEKETKQVGCAKYNYKVTQGNVNVNFDAIGYETKDFSKSFENTVAKIDMLEVGSQHIWSGWQGKCVKGMKMDSSYLSDPMTIASYAMSAYSSYTQLNGGVSALDQISNSEFASTIKSGADAVTTSIDTAYQNTVGTLFQDSANVAQGTNNVISDSYNSVKDAMKPMTDWWDTEAIKDIDGKNGIIFKSISNGDLVKFGVSTAMDILAPTQDEFKLATKLLNPFANESDVSVQAYNSCLTSIGLSYPAMVGYSFNETDAMSEQLKAPWEHPLRLTTEELQTLVTTMGQKFVQSAYKYSSNDNISINVIASNNDAYIKAGQVICAGHKVSMAMDYVSIKTASPLPSLGGTNTSAIATSVAINAVAMVNPVLGFAMRVALDLYTNMFTKIDTCTKESDAIARSMNEYKTLKFNTNGLCKEVKSYCDKYFSFGFTKKCVRDGYDFCCYDKATTKIFAEALKEQLNQGWDNCQGITINDLKDISFRECRTGEIPSVNKCISTDKFDDYKKTLFKQATRGVSVQGLAEQIKEAIKQE